MSKGRQNKPVGHVYTELVPTAATSGMAPKARVDAVWSIPTDRLSGDPSSRHTHVDEAAIAVPDRVDASTEARD